jgi:DNA invertase Pin-like site-specific DNA recombinase
MAEITVIEATRKEGKKRVCAYNRVSTDMFEQLNSFENQKNYWDGKFKDNDEVEYIGMFGDEGVSGYKTAEREGFCKMLDLVKEGKVDTVYTKSFSRFSRNEIDALETIELLRGYDVNVIFESENLDTFDPSSRFILNLLAKIAEENIHSTSENIKMVYRAKIRNGQNIQNGIYGYDTKYSKIDREYKYTVNKKQAENIKMFFNLYLEGFGCDLICRELKQRNIKAPSGKEVWAPSTILSILKDRKYLGELTLQKFYSENFIKKVNRNDNADAPLVIVENNHEPIIDKDTFDKVQSVMEDRRKRIPKYTTGHFPFTGKLICNNCGSHYIHRVHYYKRIKQYDYWLCNHKIKHREQKDCKATAIKDEVLYDLFISAYEECLGTKLSISGISVLEEKKAQCLETEKYLNMLKVKKYIDNDKFVKELKTVLEEIQQIDFKIKSKLKSGIIVKPLMPEENTNIAITKYLERATISNMTVVFSFINGFETERRYSNGTAGGQKNNHNSPLQSKRAD